MQLKKVGGINKKLSLSYNVFSLPKKIDKATNLKYIYDKNQVLNFQNNKNTGEAVFKFNGRIELFIYFLITINKGYLKKREAGTIM